MPRNLALTKALAAALGAFLFLLAAGPGKAGERLDAIKQKGVLTCGVGANVPGFSQQGANGAWRGFDVDICKAIAAAIFGDATKIAFKPIDTVENFLKTRDIDLVLLDFLMPEMTGDLVFEWTDQHGAVTRER